jgi:hypothetical protein
MEADLPLNPNCPGCAAAAKRIADLEARVATLERIIDELRRGGKRQAAPFAKSPPKPDPRKPGREPGEDYGVKSRRAIPSRIDEVHHAPLPATCPACGGDHVRRTHTAHQYQAEIPRRGGSSTRGRPTTLYFHSRWYREWGQVSSISLIAIKNDELRNRRVQVRVLQAAIRSCSTAG